MTHAIQVRNLTKRYRGGDTPAVNDISFDIPCGTIVGLLGGNGAGKTTTLSMLVGVLTPTSGSIEILGTNMVTHRYQVLERMNFASPYVDMPFRLTLYENLHVFCRLYNVKNRKERIHALAQDLELDAYLHRPYGSLSAGQKTRAAIAKALINSPECLLLDEPTASLDPDTSDWVRSYLMRYNKETGATIVLSSHTMTEVERMCDNVIMMKKGRIVDQAKPSELMTKYGMASMEDVFIHIARQLEIET